MVGFRKIGLVKETSRIYFSCMVTDNIYYEYKNNSCKNILSINYYSDVVRCLYGLPLLKTSNLTEQEFQLFKKDFNVNF